jgi:DNA modification methylase
MEIFNRIISLSSKEGEVVIDPFIGSGTTAIAANRLGRKYIGIENNEKFFKIAKERIAKETEE